MRFNYFLTTFLPSKDYGGDRLYREVIEQAVRADALGFDAVSIPEHHLINLLIVPSPLQMAVKIATLTPSVDLVISIAVLPIRDMRVLAGEVVQADILCNQRLTLGVGRGAFASELNRLDVPLAETRERFSESLAVLEALLERERVSWTGKYYNFEDVTVMPRPTRRVPIMVAVVNPEAIYQSAKNGYDIQTTPLNASHTVLLEQVDAFKRGKAEASRVGPPQKISLQRVIYLARDAADVERVGRTIYDYYKRFDNAYTGPGLIESGMIAALPRKQNFEEMMQNLLICTRSEMIDKLGLYADAGIDEVIISAGFGFPQSEMLDMMDRFADEVMPHFAGRRNLRSTEPNIYALPAPTST